MTDEERASLNEQIATLLGWTARTEPDGLAPKDSDATRTVWTRPDGTRTRHLPDFAGDWAAAGTVLAHMNHLGYSCALMDVPTHSSVLTGPTVAFRRGVHPPNIQRGDGACWAYAHGMPEAIARAALLAAGAREGE